MTQLHDARHSTQIDGPPVSDPGASTDAEGTLVLPAAHRCAILTCMDSRIDPSKLAGMRGSDAHIIRNAGARATDDAIRSLILSYRLLGTREWFVVQHSHCGMALLTEELMHELIDVSARKRGGAPEGQELRIGVPTVRAGRDVVKLALRDQEQSIVADVARIRSHPLVPGDVSIYGYIFHVETGRFVAVPNASERAVARPREVGAAPVLSLVDRAH